MNEKNFSGRSEADEREWHHSKFKNSIRQQRTIILKEAGIAKNS